MPRNNDGEVVRIPDFSDPFSLPRQPEARPASAESVISRYHPANSRDSHAPTNSATYTFRQRNMKLNLTLGWEMEANHAPTRVPNGIENIGDGSVNGEGSEFVVLPAVTRSPRYVIGLLKDLCHAPRLNTDESCGFHVHVSASNLSSIARMRQWAIATEYLALQVEALAFEAVPDSRRENQYCKKIVPICSGTSFNVHKYNNSRRYHWLNIVEMFRPNGIRTIENRLLGHTHRWKYVLSWTLFTMELARRGWELSNKPFEVTGHVDALSVMLKDIAKEIKPLSRRAEPVPQWVYNGLKTFGIEEGAWARPLARLSEVESDLRGLVRPYYSDNQPELPNEDENEDPCPCGCGDEGRCEAQTHEDGDCESNYCYRCHAGGNCDGSESCDYCQESAHENGDNCGRSHCGECNPQSRQRPAVRAVPVTYPNPVTASELFNVTPMSYAEIDGRTWVSGTFTGSTRQTFIEPTQETERRAYMMLDTHEQALSANREHSNRPRNVLPTLPEELALPMSDAERLASDARERTHTASTGRALTVSEIEAFNRRNGERLRGDR